jgi:hypothetical protein
MGRLDQPRRPTEDLRVGRRDEHPAFDPREPKGQVPPWVPVSSEGVNLLQVYEILALTPTERAQKLAQAVNALMRLKAATNRR